MSIQPLTSYNPIPVQDHSKQKVSNLSTTAEKVNYLVIIRDLLVALAFVLGAGGFILAVVFNPVWALATIPAVALAIIGIRLVSDEIDNLNKPDFVRNQPMGLKNEGNNCWINSALQLYFNLPHLHQPPLNGYSDVILPLHVAYTHYQTERENSSSGKPVLYVSKVQSQPLREWLYDKTNSDTYPHLNERLAVRYDLTQSKALIFKDEQWKLDIPVFIKEVDRASFIHFLEKIQGEKQKLVDRFNKLLNNQLSEDEMRQFSNAICTALPHPSDLKISSPESTQEDPIELFRFLFSVTHSFLPMQQTSSLVDGQRTLGNPSITQLNQQQLRLIELDLQNGGTANGYSLETLFKQFLKDEFNATNTERQTHACPTLLRRNQKTFTSAPVDFSISLKRWTIDERGAKVKIQRSLKSMPTITLNKEECKTKPTYECDGFIHHSGGYGSGHYISFIKRDGQWWELNDASYPKKINLDEAITAMETSVFFHYSIVNHNVPRPTSITSTSARLTARKSSDTA